MLHTPLRKTVPQVEELTARDSSPPAKSLRLIFKGTVRLQLQWGIMIGFSPSVTTRHA